MRIVLQKVSQASVSINPDQSMPATLTFNDQPLCERSIQQGLVLLVGVEDSDGEAEITWAAKKIAAMRIFEDEHHKLNLSVQDVQGAIMSISQFTLFANIRKGNRPSFTEAGEPNHAEKIWHQFNDTLRNEYNLPVITGIFGSHMNVSLTNDGPVTIIIDTAIMKRKQ